MMPTECKVFELHSHRVLRRGFIGAVRGILGVTMGGAGIRATISVSDVPQRPIFETWLRTLTLRICDPSIGYRGAAAVREILDRGDGTFTVEAEAVSPCPPDAFARTTIIFLETEEGERMNERFLARACAP